jgi:hypothetical protein
VLLDKLGFSLIGYKPEIAVFVPATKLEEIPKIAPQPTAENTTVRYLLENTTGYHEGFSYHCLYLAKEKTWQQTLGHDY